MSFKVRAELPEYEDIKSNISLMILIDNLRAGACQHLMSYFELSRDVEPIATGDSYQSVTSFLVSFITENERKMLERMHFSVYEYQDKTIGD